MTARLLLLMFDDVELLDFAGPYEVFTTANRMAARRDDTGAPPPFELVTASLDGRPATARAGLVLRPDVALGEAPPCDVLLVPGGVVDKLLDDAALLAELRRRSAEARITASICTGAFVLAAAGLLRDAEVTTHWEDADDLARRHPDLRVRPDRRWVDNGRFVTSAGIAAGIDMSLHLVARLTDAELAHRTARQLDVPWSDA